MSKPSNRHLHTRQRLVLTIAGLLAGLSIWLFSEVLEDWVQDPRGYLFLSAWAFGFFAMLLALLGPARMIPAVPLAGAVSLVAAALIWAGSLRHAAVEAYLQLGYPVVIYALLLLIATPFCAAALWSWRDWRSYPTLFELSWRILVRYASAVVFTALFWGLVMLSDALLRLVGLRLYELIEANSALAWGLSGAVFGLGLAVVHEMRDYLSPYLVLRLLRLFVPVVLGVVVVFLLLLPVRGMSGLVGTLSAAAILMSAALAGIVLITVALDRDAEEEVATGWLRVCVQALALLIPVLGALALYAIWVRLAQYGWTPERLMAVCIAAVVTLYGLAYGASVLLGADWAARIRRVNVAMALGILGLGALWFTPLLVPERIAAQDQLARFEAGRTPPDQVPLREMARDWGIAGAEALQVLREAPALQSRLANLDLRPTRAEDGLSGAALARAVIAQLPVQGGAVRAEMLAQLSEDEQRMWLTACARVVTGGPGCLLVLDNFAPDDAGMRGLLFLYSGADSVQARALVLQNGALRVDGYVIDAAPGSAFDLPRTVLEALHRGEGRVARPDLRMLQVEGRVLFPEY